MDDILARLWAGLDRDERAVQEALILEEPYRKLSDEDISVTIRYEWVRYTKLSTGGSGVDFLDGAPAPRDVRRQVAAHRRVIALYQRYSDLDVAAMSADDRLRVIAGRETLEGVLADLASIYPDPTDTEGATPA